MAINVVILIHYIHIFLSHIQSLKCQLSRIKSSYLLPSYLTRKIKYTDKDGDNIYVVDSGELESAIFKEGILKFDVMFFKHEIIYTVQYVNAQNPDEPNQVTFLFFSKKSTCLFSYFHPIFGWVSRTGFPDRFCLFSITHVFISIFNHYYLMRQ